jgi:predicted RNase H-like HicB family nuclease
MQRKFNVIIERDSAGWLVASVPSLPGCHTQARSFDELNARIKEVIELCLEDADETQIPEFVGVQQIAVEA